MVFLTIGTMIAIGAIIGGVTNHLAIKMLFRPHEAKYIFGKRVPFTPGLIPKRRDELAVQMGKLVVDHLVTAEGIKKKLLEASFVEELTVVAKQEVTHLFQSEKTVKDLADRFGISDLDGKVNGKLEEMLESRLQPYMAIAYRKTIQELIPSHMQVLIEGKIPYISEFIATKGIEFFQSEEGKTSLKKMVDDFLATRGMLGSMIQMFLGQGSLIEKIQPEIIKFIQHPGTKEILTKVIRKEWDKLKEKQLDDFSSLMPAEAITAFIKQKILQQFSFSEVATKPIRELFMPYKSSIVDKGIPLLFEKLLSYLAMHTEELMKKLRVDDLVRDQVTGFPVERLEDMVLSISKKEFKMITYLGALLGGIIGFFQGLIALFIG